MNSKYLFLFLLVGCFSLNINGQTDYLNNLLAKNNHSYSNFKGNFTVDQTGGAIYDIPLLSLPGTAGMSPKISVTYNSNNGSSILGEGWSLSGFSLISRGPSSLSQDGIYKPVDFSGTDKFLIDGQKLMLCNKLDYQDNGAEYRTENDQLKRIIHYGSTTPSNDYFYIQTKDGLLYWYGNYSSEISDGIVFSDGNKKMPILWLLTKIEDLNSNYITFNYNVESEGNTYEPITIQYGGNEKSKTKSYYKINFSYDNQELRPAIVKYIQGKKYTLPKLISAIETYYVDNGIPDGGSIIKYKFKYEKAGLHDISFRLKSLTECDSEDNCDTANCIIFDYSKENINESVFDAAIQYRKNIIAEEDCKIVQGDFNRDGFPDNLMIRNDGSKISFHFALNDKKGGFSSATIDTTIIVSTNSTANLCLADFDADGKTDICYTFIEANKLLARIFTPHFKSSKLDSISISSISELGQVPAIKIEDVVSSPIQIAGDARMNLASYYYNPAKKATIIYSYFVNNISSKSEVLNIDAPEEKLPMAFVDINNDGNTDLCFTWTDNKGWYVQGYLLKKDKKENLNLTAAKTTTFNTAPTTKFPDSGFNSKIDKFEFRIETGDYSKYSYHFVMDLNKDNVPDILIGTFNLGQWISVTSLGKGDGNFEASFSDTLYTMAPFKSPFISFGEFNGDGSLDIMATYTDSKGLHVCTAFGDGLGHFIARKKGEFKNLSAENFSYSIKVPTKNLLCTKEVEYAIRYNRWAELQKILVENLNATELDIYAGLNYSNGSFGTNRDMQIARNRAYSYEALWTKRNTFVGTGFYPQNSSIANMVPYNKENDCTGSLSYSINEKYNFKLIDSVWLDYSQVEVKDVGYVPIPGQDGGFIINAIFPKESHLVLSNYWKPLAIDLNCDGISDLMLTYPRQPISADETNNLTDSWNIFVSLNKSFHQGKLSEIKHSDNSIVNVDYTSVLSDTSYESIDTLNYPFSALKHPIVVVHQVLNSNGTSETMNSSIYHYTQGVISLNGRGFLGFANSRIDCKEANQYLVQTKLVQNEFLNRGLLPDIYKAAFVMDNGKPIKTSETLCQPIIINTKTPKTFICVNSRTQQSNYDLNGDTLSRFSTNYWYDKWGNIIRSVADRGENLIDSTENIYPENSNDAYDRAWMLGRLSKSTTYSFRRDEAYWKAQTICYDYQVTFNPKGNQIIVDQSNGQLIKQISNLYFDQKNIKLDSTLALVKEYAINAFGNIETSSFYPLLGGYPKRTTKTFYDRNNRFVVKTVDAENYSDSSFFDPRTAICQAKWDQNKNPMFLNSDILGRWEERLYPDGSWCRKDLFKYEDRLVPNASYYSVEKTNKSQYPNVFFYNAVGKLIRKLTFDFLGRMIFEDYKYDQKGNVTQVSLPYLKDSIILTTTIQYDNLNRPVCTTTPDRLSTKTVYSGLTVITVDPLNHKTIKIRNRLGQLIKSVDDNGYFIRYEYDITGKTTKIEDSLRISTTFKYDNNGNIVRQKDPNHIREELFTYNPYNELISSTDSKQNITIFQYDRIGRIRFKVEKEKGSIEDTIFYEYNSFDSKSHGKGLICSITSSIAGQGSHVMNEEYKYDKLGRLAHKKYINKTLIWKRKIQGLPKNPEFVFSYEYDSIGQLCKIAYPIINSDTIFLIQKYTNGIKVNSELHFMNRSSRWSKQLWSLEDINASSQTTKYKLGKDITANIEYQPANLQIAKLTYSSSHLGLIGYSYTYDSIANLKTMTNAFNPKLQETYYYDNINRIKAAVCGSQKATVDYNLNGDVTKKEFRGATMNLNFLYKTFNNQIDSLYVNGQNVYAAIKYDEAGNIIEKPGYDPNTPFQVKSQFNISNQSSVIDNKELYHDFGGRRQLLIDGDDGSFDFNLDNLFEVSLRNLTFFKKSYVYNKGKYNFYENGRLIASLLTDVESPDEDAQLVFYLSDGLNSVIQLTDSVGRKIGDEMAYDYWGQPRNPNDWKYDFSKEYIMDSTGNTVRYLGQFYLNDQSLYDFGARIYDPVIGRFISTDPVISNIASPTQFYNGYAYGYNNNNKFVDANGKFPWVFFAFAVYFGASMEGGSFAPWEWNSNWWKGAVIAGASVVGGELLGGAMAGLGTTAEEAGMLHAIGAGFGSSFSSSFAGTLVNGGNFSQALDHSFQSGLIGTAMGGITYGIGHQIPGLQNPSLGSSSYFLKSGAHGLAQGIFNEILMSGDFKHGFMAGALTELSQPVYGFSTISAEGKTISSAIVGGTVSSIGGGKFANGAISGAFIQIYNHNGGSWENHAWGSKQEVVPTTEELLDGIGKLTDVVTGMPEGSMPEGMQGGIKALGAANTFILSPFTAAYQIEILHKDPSMIITCNMISLATGLSLAETGPQFAIPAAWLVNQQCESIWPKFINSIGIGSELLMQRFRR